jgi:hypothetical protein
MSDHDTDDLLDAAGWGVLAVASDDDPYSIPISFAYDGSDLYFGLVREGSTNRKFTFVSEGARGRLLVTDIDSQFDWQSVAVTGTLRRIDREGDRWATFQDELSGNNWFSATSERAAGTPEGGLEGWRLVPDEIDGREVQPVY